MRKYEFVFDSVNTEIYPKPITVFSLIPDKINSNSGIMLFTHGWGGNRYQHRDKMEYVCEKFNLICLSTEYRQSGFDFNSVSGSGASAPYDASFYQVFDVLNTLRASLSIYPMVNRNRIYHYGGSQGGHIALLSGIFAPDTFAFIYASSPMTHIDSKKYAITGREFSSWEMKIRNVTANADKLKCPIFLEHGTGDDNVPCETHTKALESQLRKHGKTVTARYYENGGHDLQPAISKLDAFKTMISENILNLSREYPDDFILGSKTIVPCGEKALHIDWSKPVSDTTLFRWENL